MKEGNFNKKLHIQISQTKQKRSARFVKLTFGCSNFKPIMDILRSSMSFDLLTLHQFWKRLLRHKLL